MPCSCLVSLDFSWLWQFLRLSLMTLTFPKSAVRHFLGWPSAGACLMYFSWEAQRGKVPFPWFFQGYIPICLITAGLDLDLPAQGVCQVLSLSGSPPSPCLCPLNSLEGNAVRSSCLWGRDVWSYSLKVKLFGTFLQGRVASSPYSLVYVIIYSYQYGLRNTDFILWVMLQYYF